MRAAQVVAINFIDPVNAINSFNGWSRIAPFEEDVKIVREGRTEVCLKIINRGLMVRPFLIGLLASDFVNYQSKTSYQIRDIVVFENLLCCQQT